MELTTHEKRILTHYKQKRILATIRGEEAFKTIVGIRYTHPSFKARIKRTYKFHDKAHCFLVIYAIPKKGEPTAIRTDFYLDSRIPGFAELDGEMETIWIDQFSPDTLRADRKPKALYNLVKEAYPDTA